MMMLLLLLLAQAPQATKPTIYITPTEDNFEVYIGAAMSKKKVPVTVTKKAENADYVLTTSGVESRAPVFDPAAIHEETPGDLRSGRLLLDRRSRSRRETRSSGPTRSTRDADRRTVSRSLKP